MGVIKRGVLGGFSGKVANVVGSSWKGIAVMKSLPLSVANPRTVGQVNQRTKFAAVVSVGSQALTAIVKPLWDRFAQKESGYNAFVSANINAFTDTGNILLPQFRSSRGALQAITAISASLSGITQSLSGTFISNVGVGNALPTDTIQIMLIDETTNEVNAYNLTTDRATGSFGVLTTDNVVSGRTYGLYLSVSRADGSIVSDSSFLSVIAS